MVNEPDYLIVGAGLTGSVIARLLVDKGYSVLMLERREHLGGNVFDLYHESGIRVHTYGPHYFRTSNEKVWEFVNRFSSFYHYEACLKVRLGGRYENWPIAASYIRRQVGDNWQAEYVGTPSNFEEAALSLMPRAIYETFVREYTEKQWGKPCRELSAELCGRFSVHLDDDPRLTPNAKYQGLPTEGYAKMMQNLVAGIPVRLNCDYLQRKTEFKAKALVIFTGPIDEYFGFSLGKLAYRGQRRETEYLSSTAWYQPCAQVNEPFHATGPHIRTLEWKHMMPADSVRTSDGTVITREIPFSPVRPDQYEYPFPDQRNQELYEAYRNFAQKDPNVLICGRLGEYKYLDMDKAIERAFCHVNNICR